MQKLHFLLTPQDIRIKAQRLGHSKNKLAEARGETIGINWYNKVFLKDNPEMANKMGKGLDWDWATCASHTQLAAWYADLMAAKTKYNIQFENSWNMDEKGYLLGLGTAQVYCVSHGTKEAKKMQDGNCELVTVIEAISASGSTHYPTILLKGKTLQGHWLTHHIPGASYGNTERGWTTDEEAITWLKGFIESTKLTNPDCWRLLLLDGHGSHKTIDFISMCLENKILPFCFIPHSTHLCQPLDVVIFSQMQRAYGKIVCEYQKSNIKINKVEFSCMLKRVQDQVLQLSNIVQAFSASGMRPLDFAASYAYKQVPPPSSVATVEEEWIDSDFGKEAEFTHSSDLVTLTMLTNSQSAPHFSHSTSRSTSRSQSHSQANSCSSTLGPQSHQIHTECLKEIDTRLAALTIDATPHHVADLCKDTLDATQQDAACDASTATLVNVIKVQNQVIERQHTCHILNNQLHSHLKTQLANKGHSREQTGGVLKHGYGALDSSALDALEEEAATKRAEAEEKQWQREEAVTERQRKKDETPSHVQSPHIITSR